MEILLITILLMAIAFLALGFNIFFRKEGKFPETEVGHNRKMKELGITCPRCDEMRLLNEEKKRRKPKIKPSELKIDMQ